MYVLNCLCSVFSGFPKTKVWIGLKPLMLIGIMMRFSLTKEGSVINYGSIDGQSELTLEPAHVHK